MGETGGRKGPGRPVRASTGAPLLVTVIDDARVVSGAALGRWLRGVAPRSARGRVEIVLMADAGVRSLNRRFRGADRVTDVLSFPMDESDPSHHRPARIRSSPAARRAARRPGGEAMLGSIVIARDLARRQARRFGHPLAAEIRLLALHGLLHLAGYDHEADDGRMARLERRLGRRGRLPVALIDRGAGT